MSAPTRSDRSPSAAAAGVDGAGAVHGIAERVFGSNLRGPWLVASFVGFAIGATVWGGVLRAIDGPYYGSNVSVMEAARIQAIGSGVTGIAFGLVIGTSQWYVLRRAIRADWWIPATCVGFALGGAISGFSSGGSTSTIGPDEGPLPPPLGLLTIPLVIAVFGFGQWLILRRQVQGAGWWPLVNAVALGAGFGIGLVFAMVLPWLEGTDFPSAKALVFVGLAGGPVYAGLTWLFLSQLRPASGSVVESGP